MPDFSVLSESKNSDPHVPTIRGALVERLLTSSNLWRVLNSKIYVTNKILIIPDESLKQGSKRSSCDALGLKSLLLLF